jgi:type IV pilus assembly protein PilA
MLTTLRSKMQRDEDGFTLIELMVVVLIIAILIAIAIPTFLGARERAQDRAAQSNIRNAFTAEKVVYTDDQAYTAVTATLAAIEPSLSFAAGETPDATADVFVHVASGVVYVSALSDSGDCFYLKDDPTAGTTYDSDTDGTCSAATSFGYTADSW